MGLKIDRNKKGLYKLTETIGGERLHDKLWITEKEAIKTLVLRRWWKFQEEILQIYMDFPGGYQVNGLFGEKNDCKGLEFIIDALKTDPNKINTKFAEICKDLDITIDTTDDEKTK